MYAAQTITKKVKFPPLKDDYVFAIAKRDESESPDLKLMYKHLMSIPPKDRESYIFSSDFLELCEIRSVFGFLGRTKTKSIVSLVPNQPREEVFFFTEQKKSHIKKTESVMVLNDFSLLTTQHKKPKPLSLKRVTIPELKRGMGEVQVNTRTIIDGTNKKNNKIEIMSVWVWNTPYISIPIADETGKIIDDFVIVSAKRMKPFNNVEYDRLKTLHDEMNGIFREHR